MEDDDKKYLRLEAVSMAIELSSEYQNDLDAILHDADRILEYINRKG
jgi:hypothetical protein